MSIPNSKDEKIALNPQRRGPESMAAEEFTVYDSLPQ